MSDITEVDLTGDSPKKTSFQPKAQFSFNKPPNSSPVKLEPPAPALEVYIPDNPVPLESKVVKPEPVPTPEVKYMMAGTPVTFPCKAYPSQVAIMGKVIKGLQEAQNCLLESPTGSGKTLALLCSSLAWQRVEKEKLHQQMTEYFAQQQEKELQRFAQVGSESFCVCGKKEAVISHAEATVGNPEHAEPPAGVVQQEDECSSDDDFKPMKKRQKGITYIANNTENRPPNGDPEALAAGRYGVPVAVPGVDTIPSTVPGVVASAATNVCTCGAWERQRQQRKAQGSSPLDDDDDKMPTVSVPKIFYGTRTHKQITQVVRELGRTVYKDVKMTILGSREHSCIQTNMRGLKSKTELCHDLLDKKKGQGCTFKTNSDMYLSNHTQLIGYECPEPFDIEDLVVIGRQTQCCPYFSARTLMKTAELVFCPYNYLIDSHILESTQVKLEGNIVILDEAHNIEDIAREAASHTADFESLKKAVEDCRMVAKAGRLKEMHQFLEDFLVRLMGWIEAQDHLLVKTEEYNKTSYSIPGLDAIASFSMARLGPDVFQYFKSALSAVIADMQAAGSKRDQKKQLEQPVISQVTKIVLQGLERVLADLFASDSSHTDFQITVIKEMERVNSTPATGGGGWRSVQTGADSSWKVTLNFWCQNPAVAMRYMRDATRSVILTSGTLAPVDSFSSELGVEFPIKFEANHVIDRSQAYITTTTHGPLKFSLNAQYKNADTYDFQDELGRLVIDTCRVVPHGILCFVPSYKLMEKLLARWDSTGAWDALMGLKAVFSEPRRATALEGVMDSFRRAIREPPNHGAILFAVHRGKVSEGIDFADDQARAVIAVGIPYPNFMDSRVVLKRKYNDQYCQSRGLLSGSRWYEIQAYRALNQALGRCIRHKNDWGSVILVDDRFSKSPQYTNGLSKWIRNMVWLKWFHGCCSARLG